VTGRAVEKHSIQTDLNDDEEYGLIPVVGLTYEEGLAVLNLQARKRLNMSGEEFLRRWQADDFTEEFKDEHHSAFVVLSILAAPFLQQDSSRALESRSRSERQGETMSASAASLGDKQLVLTEDEAFDLLAFLFSSAEICLVEPTYYGTFRLVDAASRLMGYMLAHDPERSAEFLHRFKEEVDTKKVWMMWDREAYYDFLRAAPATVAAEMKRLEEERPRATEGVQS
jgi:hypothetical protein